MGRGMGSKIFLNQILINSEELFNRPHSKLLMTQVRVLFQFGNIVQKTMKKPIEKIIIEYEPIFDFERGLIKIQWHLL
jgi:hypothetical protein